MLEYHTIGHISIAATEAIELRYKLRSAGITLHLDLIFNNCRIPIVEHSTVRSIFDYYNSWQESNKK